MSNKIVFRASAKNFCKIPGSPIAYWVGERIVDAWQDSKTLGETCDTKKGLATSDNNKFMRLWFEVSIAKISFHCMSNEDTRTMQYKWYM